MFRVSMFAFLILCCLLVLELFIITFAKVMSTSKRERWGWFHWNIKNNNLYCIKSPYFVTTKLKLVLISVVSNETSYEKYYSLVIVKQRKCCFIWNLFRKNCAFVLVKSSNCFTETVHQNNALLIVKKLVSFH
jgi:hypothetical protein